MCCQIPLQTLSTAAASLHVLLLLVAHGCSCDVRPMEWHKLEPVTCLAGLLQDDAGDEEEAADADGEEDEEGFVVGDGYLSEDEGMKDTDDIDAADLVGATSGDSSACEQAAVAQLEAGLERAWQRGRPLVLVNNYPDMSWEPTSSESAFEGDYSGAYYK